MAPPGVGKTNAVQAVIAAAITPFGIDSLGFSVNAKALTYFDTERSVRDTYKGCVLTRKRAQYNDSEKMLPDEIQWLNLRGVGEVEEKQEFLFSRIDIETPPEIVLIDGIGDFVYDVNDPKECKSLITALSAIAHNRNIGILVTLHVNPSENSTKPRGHLGSELMRYAECSLFIEKRAEGVRALTTQFAHGKNRSASDDITSCFKWSDEYKMHVSCDPPMEQANRGKTKIEREQIIAHMGNKEWAYDSLVKLLMKDLGKGKSTAKRWIADLLEIGMIQKINEGIYRAENTSETDKKQDWIHD